MCLRGIPGEVLVFGENIKPDSVAARVSTYSDFIVFIRNIECP